MDWYNIQKLVFNDLLQIVALWVVFYYIFLFFKGTRGAQVLVGLVLSLVILLLLTRAFNLDVLAWILQRFYVALGVALLVIFQPEIRRALAELGKQPVFVVSSEKRTVIEPVVQAVSMLSSQKIGALIAFEREIGTRGIQETGVQINAPVVPELLASLFYPHTPLHDGGVILKDNKVVAAGCVFPLSQNPNIQRTLGTRHRAAIGLTEETDAVVVVISEETGTIAVCYRGRISRGLDNEKLKRFLTALLKGRRADSAWKRVQEQLDFTPTGIAKSDKLST